MMRKPMTIAVLSLFPLCAMTGLLSGCNTAAGFGRDMAATGDWLSRQFAGGGGTPTATGTSIAPTTEDQVRKNLQDHGYSNASDLRRSGDNWVGSAVDSTGKRVHVSVDPNGVVTIAP